MSLFLWKKSYETGIAEVDDQHRQLVGIINKLSDAMMEQKGYMTVPRILEELADYVQLHFTTEEWIMGNSGYPALEEHKKEHLKLTDSLLQFRKEFSQDHKVKPSEVLNFLCVWLKEHILVNDKEFGSFFKNLPAAEKQSTRSGI